MSFSQIVMLPNLHHPDRHVATFARETLCLETPSFVFDSKYFLNEVFNALPSPATDTSQLESALIHDDNYHESTEHDQQETDRNATPIDPTQFVLLIDDLIGLLELELLADNEHPIIFRTAPDQHKNVLIKARKFLLDNADCKLFLVIYQEA